MSEKITLNRSEILALMNQNGLGSQIQTLQMEMLKKALRCVVNNDLEDGFAITDPEGMRKVDRMLLQGMGPAAATVAIEHAIRFSGNKLESVRLTNNLSTNRDLILNGPCDAGYPSFSTTLRQFLLPRYAYLDFDNIVDPRHPIDSECGYPKFVTPIMYRYMYDRDDVAQRVVDIYPDECWAVDPSVYEDEDESTDTPFEDRWRYLVEEKNILQIMYRMDKLCGIGHYGVLLLGLNDGLDLDQPVRGTIFQGGMTDGTLAADAPPLDILYFRPFDEYLSYIQEYDTNVGSPRYGLPIYYNLVFLDMTIDAAGASIGTRLNRRVHWTRVVHIADNLMSSLVFGIPRMQPVFNRLLDLRKIKSSSAEIFWKGAFPGLAFEMDPQYVADNPELDMDAVKKELTNYSSGMSRFLSLIGIKAHSLEVNISDHPDKYTQIHLSAVCANKNIPMSVWNGNEEGKLASSENRLMWNKRLKKRNNRFTTPGIIRRIIDRLIQLRILPKPKRYFVEWPDLDSLTPDDKANLSLKWTQAMSQYVSSGCVHLMQPLDFMTIVMGLSPAEGKKVLASAPPGGLATLLKVDPSQGSGVNGKREDIAGGSKSSSTGRQTSDRRIEAKE